MCHPEEVNTAPDASDPADGPDEFDPAYWGGLLANGVERCLPLWIRRCVVVRFAQATGRGVVDGPLDAAVDAGIDEAVGLAISSMMEPLRTLLATDVDSQRGTPLTIIRSAVRFPTTVLASLDIPEVARDPFAAQAFPDDVYDLCPGSWGDIDESLAELGLRWSVAKAYEFKRRHERSGD